MSDRRIKFIGVFPSEFPGWGRDVEPVRHRKYQVKTGAYDGEEYVCDMAFHPAHGVCMSCRYAPLGVSGIDANGDCWVLVRDLAYQDGGDKAKGLRWVRFPVEVAE